MPTRKELIDQARATQRHQAIGDQSDNAKTAIVGIGDRDPRSGQHQVLLPDGSVEMGEKQFNSSLPTGAQVLGVPQEVGDWLLDERDVQPISPPPPRSPYGKVKVLFSTIEGDERVFWVGGDRRTPKRVYSTPSSRTVDAALLSNAGNGNLFFVSLSHSAGNGLDGESVTVSPHKKYPVASAEVYPTGHGFWTQTLGISSLGTPLESVSFALVSHSQFLGDALDITGGQVSADGIDRPYPRVDRGSSNNAISPKIDKLTQSFTSQNSTGGGADYLRSDRIASVETRRALVLGKKAASAIYESIDFRREEVVYLGFISGQEKPPDVITESSTNDLILVDCVTKKEIKLDGDLGFRYPANAFSWVYPIKLINLIRQQLYVVNFGQMITEFGQALDIPSALWDTKRSKSLSINVYKLGAPTTKRSTSAKVYALKPNATVYSISYNPG
jgi:hypothetical protein